MSTQEPPRTVALVLHFRNHELTSKCLASLEAERVHKVVLVDNSDDGGKSLARLFRDDYARYWPSLSIDRLEPGVNLGFSLAINRGLEHIRKSYGPCCVLLLNSDAELHRGSHAAMRDGVRKGLELASAVMVLPNGTKIGWVYYQPYVAILSRYRLPGSFRYLSACCVLLGPTLVAHPLFEERFFFYGEDIELGWRLSITGIAHDVIEGAFVAHEGSAASEHGSFFYEYHMARAHLLLPPCLTRAPTKRMAMYLARIVVLPLRATIRSMRSLSLSPWKGLIFAIGHVIQRKTPSVQPLRG